MICKYQGEIRGGCGRKKMKHVFFRKKKEGDGADIVCFGKPTKRACLSSPNHVSWDWGRQNKQNDSLDSQETRMFWTYQNQVVLEKIRETHCIGVVWSGAVLELIMTCGERSKQNTNKPARMRRHLTGRQGYIIQLPETYLPVEILGILTSSGPTWISCTHPKSP